MKLAAQLGSFAGQLTESDLKSVTIEYAGHASELNTKPLSAALLQGLLAPMLDSVNMVNAPVMASERGIELSEVRTERAGDYQTLIRLTVVTNKQARSVTGTLFGGNRPRVIDVKGVPLEAELRSHMLYVTNKDKPGLIGLLGTVLGDAGLNIATFQLGRTEAGGDAIALVEVDQAVPAAVLAKVAALPNVVQAKALNF